MDPITLFLAEEAGIQEQVTEILAQHDIRVIGKPNLKWDSALLQIRQHNPDIAFITLAKANLARVLKLSWSGGLVVATYEAPQALYQESDAVLIKPYSPRQLIDSILPLTERFGTRIAHIGDFIDMNPPRREIGYQYTGINGHGESIVIQVCRVRIFNRPQAGVFVAGYHGGQ